MKAVLSNRKRSWLRRRIEKFDGFEAVSSLFAYALAIITLLSIVSLTMDDVYLGVTLTVVSMFLSAIVVMMLVSVVAFSVVKKVNRSRKIADDMAQHKLDPGNINIPENLRQRRLKP